MGIKNIKKLKLQHFKFLDLIKCNVETGLSKTILSSIGQKWQITDSKQKISPPHALENHQEGSIRLAVFSTFTSSQ
jgi:hypothetical protein